MPREYDYTSDDENTPLSVSSTKKSKASPKDKNVPSRYNSTIYSKPRLVMPSTQPLSSINVCLDSSDSESENYYLLVKGKASKGKSTKGKSTKGKQEKEKQENKTPIKRNKRKLDSSTNESSPELNLRRSPRIKKKTSTDEKANEIASKDTVNVDSSDDNDTIVIQDDRNRSPTPPPVIQQGRRKKRRPKHVTQTLRHLAKLKKQMDRQEAEEPSMELNTSTDCYITQDTTQDSDAGGSEDCKIRIIAPNKTVFRFTLPQSEPLEQIFTKMSVHLKVPTSRVLMYKDDQTIHPYDTPQSLQLTFADTIECHINIDEDAHNDSLVFNSLDSSLVRIIVQGKNRKENVTIVMKKTESMLRLMQHYANKVSKSLERLSFQFDGDPLVKTDTPDALGIEDEDCVDVFVQ